MSRERLIWTVLYPIIAVAYGFVIVQVIRQQMPARVIVPVAINIAANLAFTPIQFGLRNLPLATVDIFIVLATILWSMWWIWPHARWPVYALVPYLAWVSTATVLQVSITLMNR